MVSSSKFQQITSFFPPEEKEEKKKKTTCTTISFCLTCVKQGDGVVSHKPHNEGCAKKKNSAITTQSVRDVEHFAARKYYLQNENNPRVTNAPYFADLKAKAEMVQGRPKGSSPLCVCGERFLLKNSRADMNGARNNYYSCPRCKSTAPYKDPEEEFASRKKEDKKRRHESEDEAVCDLFFKEDHMIQCEQQRVTTVDRVLIDLTVDSDNKKKTVVDLTY
jgi:hypothetical protein